jgi:hypothetical protein
MALADSSGTPTTSRNIKALEYFNQAQDDFLHFRGALVENIDQSIHEDPDFALGHACKAYVGVLGTEPHEAAKSRRSFETYIANADLAKLLERERMHLEAAQILLEGDFLAAGQLLHKISKQYPRDLLALSIGHQIDFFTGNTSMLLNRIESALPAWTPEDKHYSTMMGMLSFGLEEGGQYERAEQAGLEAVERNAKDVWAIHAVTHTYEMQAQFQKGMKYLDQRLNDWATGNFFLNHNWWHYALYTLESGHDERALKIHDTVLFTEDQASIALQLLDATALCWRLHLEGHNVKDRFQKHAVYWKEKLEPAFYAFNDMHMMMAFVGAGLEQEAQQLIQSRETWLVRPPHSNHVGSELSNVRMTRKIGLPVCKAILAFGQERYQEVVDYLYPIRHQLHEFGGSHAQRDVVLQTLLVAALKAGNARISKELLAERLDAKPRSPYNWLKQATLLEQMGERLEGAVAKEKALQYRQKD